MIRSLVNGCAGITGWMEEKTRSKIRTVLYFLFFFTCLLYVCVPGLYRILKFSIAALMGLIVLFTVKKDPQPSQWNWPAVLLWMLLGVFQLIAGLRVSSDYLTLAVIWLIGFPILFFLWCCRKDHSALLLEAAKGANGALLIFLVGSIIIIPITQAQYGGLVGNPNGVGQWMTFGLPVVLYLYYAGVRSNAGRWLYRIEFSLIAFFLLVARGRTAVISCFMISAAFLVIRLRTQKSDWKHYCRQAGVLVVCFFLTSSISLGVNQMVHKLVIGSPFVQTRLSEIKGDVGGDASADSYFLSEDETHMIGAQKAVINLFVNRITGQGRLDSLNSYSSGRINIWKNVLANVDWRGHSPEDSFAPEESGYTKEQLQAGYLWRDAHNVPLQFAYEHGIQAGIAYVLMALYGFLTIAKRALRRGKLWSADTFFLLFQAGYGCTAMLANVMSPFGYPITFMYYLSFAALFIKENTYQ